jgi:hypothetical protein
VTASIILTHPCLRYRIRPIPRDCSKIASSIRRDGFVPTSASAPMRWPGLPGTRSPTETGLTSGRLKEFPSLCVNYDT